MKKNSKVATVKVLVVLLVMLLTSSSLVFASVDTRIPDETTYTKTVTESAYRCLTDRTGKFVTEAKVTSKLTLVMRLSNVTGEEWIESCTRTSFVLDYSSDDGALCKVDRSTPKISSDNKTVTTDIWFTIVEQKLVFEPTGTYKNVYYDSGMTHSYSVD